MPRASITSKRLIAHVRHVNAQVLAVARLQVSQAVTLRSHQRADAEAPLQQLSRHRQAQTASGPRDQKLLIHAPAYSTLSLQRWRFLTAAINELPASPGVTACPSPVAARPDRR